PPADQPRRVLVRTDMPKHPDGSIRAVRLTVRDNGPGFPDKILKRAFEPYTTTKAKGTGLGLAVVKKIADEHHALVRIRNLESEINMPRPPGKSLDEGSWRGAQVSLSFSKLSSTLPQAGSH
ncbi:MAG: ATP-binding protein, partial [Pseudomonadota bacterium]